MATTGQIPNNITLLADQSVRRNAGDTAFEAFTVGETVTSQEKALFTNLMSTGIIYGGVPTINAGDNTKFDVSEIKCVFVDNYTDPDNPTFSIETFGPWTAQTVTNLATQAATFLTVNSSGNIIQKDVDVTSADVKDIVVIGALVHASLTQIDAVSKFSGPNTAYIGNSVMDLSIAVGLINKDGNLFSANGANLKINKSAGKTMFIGANLPADQAGGETKRQDPNTLSTTGLDPVTFLYTWRDGVGGFNINVTTDLIPSVYDDGTGGAIQPNGVTGVPNFSTSRIYFAPGSQTIIVHYGQNTYGSIAAALAEINTEDFEINPLVNGLSFRGWIIAKGNTTDLSNTLEAKFLQANKFGDTSGGAASTGSATTTLQQAYDNSVEPEILTNTTLGALSLKRGSGADTDCIIEGQNGTGTQTFCVTGEGNTSVKALAIDGVNSNAYTDAEKVVIGNTSGINTGDQDLSGYQLTSEKDTANGYAGLDASSKINPLQLPALAISETFVVASEVAQLALTVQEGDIAVRTDLSESYIALNDTNATMADWQKLLTPTDAVSSVAGKTGVVTLDKNDVGLDQVDNTSDLNKPVSTATQTALNGKEPTFTKNTGFNKNLGTGVGTVSEGNHLHTGVYAPVLGADDNYVTDAEKIVIGNTSNTNTGDQDLSTYVTKTGVETLTNKTVNGVSLTTGGVATNFLDATGNYSAPAGGGGASIYEATVGPTGDYTTLGAAITAGKTRVLIIGDTTETADITLPSNAVIHGIGREAVNVNMVTFKFLDNTGANVGFEIDNLKITYAYTSGYALFKNFNKLKVNNVYFDNNSTNASTYCIDNAISGDKGHIKNVIINLPNLALTGIRVNVLKGDFIIDGVNIIGGGTSCYGTLNCSGCLVNNISMEGTFSTSTSGILYFQSCTVSGLFYYGVTNGALIKTIFSSVNNIYGDSNAGDLYIEAGYNSSISDVVLREAGSKISLTGTSATLTNVLGSTITIESTSVGNVINNCTVTSGIFTSTGNFTIFSGISTTGTISITGNDCTLTGCKVGADAGGGSNTITVNAGATRTIIGNCRVDAAIVDNGTDTVADYVTY